MHQPHDIIAQHRPQVFEPLIGSGQIHDLGFFDQRTDPVTLPSLGNGAAQVVHHLGHTFGAEDRGLDRFTSRWLLVEDRDLHIAVLGQRQRARDRRRGHHQHIGTLALFSQLHPLPHAKSVLFVDNDQPQIVKDNILLKHRVGADKDMNIATLQRLGLGAPVLALVTPGQDLKHHTGVIGQRFQPLKMLTCKDFCRRHHHALPTGLHGHQQRHKGHQRLARPDITLQQPVHTPPGGHIGGDLLDRAPLCARGLIRQCREHFVLQFSRGDRAASGLFTFNRAGNGQRQLVGEQLIIGKPGPRRGFGLQIAQVPRRMGCGDGLVPIRPAPFGLIGCIHPFGEFGHPLQGTLHRLEHGFLRDAVSQVIHRFEIRNIARLLQRQHVIRVDHLRHAVEQFQLARNHTAGPFRQLRGQITAAPVEKDQLKLRFLIRHIDPVGPALVARGAMSPDRDLNRRRRR